MAVKVANVSTLSLYKSVDDQIRDVMKFLTTQKRAEKLFGRFQNCLSDRVFDEYIERVENDINVAKEMIGTPGLDGENQDAWCYDRIEQAENHLTLIESARTVPPLSVLETCMGMHSVYALTMISDFYAYSLP